MDKKIIGALILSCALMAAPFISSADTMSDLQAQINSLLQQLHALQAQQQTSTQSTAPSGNESSGASSQAQCPNLAMTLSVGSADAKTNGQVSQLQQFLTDNLNINEDIVTGYFGRKTAQYVKQFQAAHGLEQVGWAGRQTRAAIAAVCQGSGTPVSQPLPGGTHPVGLPVACSAIAQFCPAGQHDVVGTDCSHTCVLDTPICNGMGFACIEGYHAVTGTNASGCPIQQCVPDSTTAASCTFNGQTIASGQSVTAYQTSSVASGSQCVSQTRTCASGTLSGSYQYAACTTPAVFLHACTANMLHCPDGQQAVSTGTDANGCPLSFQCVPVQSGSCTFNGQTIANGASVTAYQASNMAYGQQCVSQIRTCINGTLSGSYAYTSCTAGAANTCSWNGQSVANGANVTAYQTSSAPYGSSCVSEQRACTNGTLNGSYQYALCCTTAAASCTFNGQSVANGQSVTAYASATAPPGAACVGETRMCTNGVLSGSNTFASCTPSALTATQDPLCVVDHAAVSNSTDYTSNPGVYATLCGAAPSLTVANPGWDTWLDVTVKNDSSCPAGTDSRIDYWILARDIGANTIVPVRFKSVYQGELSKSHVDLGKYAWNGKSLQFIMVTEMSPGAKSCDKLTVQSASTATRTQLIPDSDRADALLKSNFDTRLSKRPGFANVWDWDSWRRTPVMAKMMGDLSVPYFRTFLQPLVSNVHGCNSQARDQGLDYRYCFADDVQIDEMDNAVEELFYRGVPIMANVSGLQFSDNGVQQVTNNYSDPHAFMSLYKYSDSHIWDWGQNRFVSLDSRGSQSVKDFLGNAYQYYRYDFNYPDFTYGVTDAVLNRYNAAIVAVEPGNEQNSHPPAMRSQDPAEQAFTQSESINYFNHFCDYAHAHGKYCIMTSMADSVTWTNDPSGSLSAKIMLQKYAAVASKADFANFHLYLSDQIGPRTYDNFTNFIKKSLADYGPLLAGKKVIITEFGYDQDSDLLPPAPKDQLINAMRSFMSANTSLIAGSSYWMDIGNVWQKTKRNSSGNVYLYSAPLMPFDYAGSCPAGAFCPFVQTCSFSSNSCPDNSATGQAWAYKHNDVFYNQFAW